MPEHLLYVQRLQWLHVHKSPPDVFFDDPFVVHMDNHLEDDTLDGNALTLSLRVATVLKY